MINPVGIMNIPVSIVLSIGIPAIWYPMCEDMMNMGK
jgi:hypothetical protein